MEAKEGREGAEEVDGVIKTRNCAEIEIFGGSGKVCGFFGESRRKC